MRTRIALAIGTAVAASLGWTVVFGQQAAPKPTFKTNLNLVRVDVTVRDKDGKTIHNLTKDDFQVFEDGKPQAITSFDFTEIPNEPAPDTTEDVDVKAAPSISIQAGLAQSRQQVLAASSKKPVADVPANTPLEKMPGKRVIVLLFDTSSMQPDDIDRAVKSANDFVDHTMEAADVVSITAVGQTLQVLTKPDFVSDKKAIKAALAALDGTSGTGFEQPVAADTTDTTVDDTSTSNDTSSTDITLDDSEFGVFNNDRRLQAMQVLCQAMGYVETKKLMLYFSGGMSRSGNDNQIALRNMTSSCNRANVSIFTMDSRGLQALPPGGTGRSSGGQGAFSGRNVTNQFSQLAASQETLSTMAQDTGGQVFLDTNDFSKVFKAAEEAVSAYYLIGYSSSNEVLDGKYRKIEVKVKTPGAKVESRKGYYAGTDFAHLAKEGRQQQLQDQISSPTAVTDLPVTATTTWFRIGDNKFFVPLSIAVPGSALPPPKPKQTSEELELLGVMVDEQGRAIGKIGPQTVPVPVGAQVDLSKAQIQYQAGVALPAGHFMVKVAVRENNDGTLGAFQFPITIPDLSQLPLKVSPIVFSTQLRSVRGGGPGGRGGPGGGGGGRGDFGGPAISGRGGARGQIQMWGDQTPNPLISGGQEILQSLTNVVTKAQRMYFYYEVYDPPTDAAGAPKLHTSLAFYRGKVKVFETPVVDKTTIDDATRHASIFQFAVPAADLKAGLYTCQINIVDDVNGKFAFPRIALYVKP